MLDLPPDPTITTFNALYHDISDGVPHYFVAYLISNKDSTVMALAKVNSNTNQVVVSKTHSMNDKKPDSNVLVNAAN